METSRPPGNISSNTGSADSSPIGRLEHIANQPELKRLRGILGEDADLHIVGGTVRVCVLASGSTDLDIATKLEPEAVLERLTAAGVRVVETGIEHGTVLAVFDETHIEITTFRKPGPRSETRFSDTIEQDLAGRDFTVNAMAYAIGSRTIIDPWNGLADLEAKTIRAVESATERFQEDPQRILRMIRFGPARGFTIEEGTLAAATELVPLLDRISTERIRDELEKILVAPGVTEAFRSMRETGILDQILPELIRTYDFEQNEYHIHDVFEHTLWVLDRAKPELIVRTAALFHDIGKPDTLSVDEAGRRHFYKHELESAEICKQAMQRLLFPKKFTRDTAQLVRLHMRPLDCGPSAVRRLMRDLGPLFDDWLALKLADAPPVMPPEEYQQQVDAFLALKRNEDERSLARQRSGLAISGEDLKTLGIPEGPGLGAVLSLLEEHILDVPEANEPDTLRTLALKYWQEQEDS